MGGGMFLWHGWGGNAEWRGWEGNVNLRRMRGNLICDWWGGMLIWDAWRECGFETGWGNVDLSRMEDGILIWVAWWTECWVFVKEIFQPPRSSWFINFAFFGLLNYFSTTPLLPLSSFLHMEKNLNSIIKHLNVIYEYYPIVFHQNQV